MLSARGREPVSLFIRSTSGNALSTESVELSNLNINMPSRMAPIRSIKVGLKTLMIETIFRKGENRSHVKRNGHGVYRLFAEFTSAKNYAICFTFHQTQWPANGLRKKKLEQNECLSQKKSLKSK